MKNLIFTFLFIFAIIFCKADPSPIAIPITLEHAKTDDELRWGLMQRSSLPTNYGMLFHYPKNQKVIFWMFGCLIDLDVAFLDQNGVIREIKELKAYPDKMDPKRPLKTVADLAKYRWNDPEVVFFRTRGVSSSFPIAYALEVQKGWFENNGVECGDRLDFKGYILREPSRETNKSDSPVLDQIH